MIRDDLDSLYHTPYRLSLWRLWLVIVLLVCLTLGGCALVFRWTTHDLSEVPYSAPLRTRPPTAQPKRRRL